jgi:hypothetical protein
VIEKMIVLLVLDLKRVLLKCLKGTYTSPTTAISSIPEYVIWGYP